VISVEVALYPQDSSDSDSVINSSLQALGDKGLRYDVGPVSTFFAGSSDQVWEGLRTLFEAAESQGREVAMVATVTNSQV
jgi:uncharacterized protein YqgV (UPF0045/DUF77 family)